MDMTQMMLQMMISASMGTGSLLPGTNTAGQAQGQDSFQSLLEDKRAQADQAAGQEKPSTDKKQDGVEDKPTGQEGGDKKEEIQANPEGAAVLMADLQPMFLQVQPAEVEEPQMQVVTATPMQMVDTAQQGEQVVQQAPAAGQMAAQQGQEFQQAVRNPAQDQQSSAVPQQEAEQAVPTVQPQQGQVESQDAGNLTRGRQAAAQQGGETVQSPVSDTAPDQPEQAIPTQAVFQETGHMPVKVGEPAALDTTSEDFDVQLKQVVQQAADEGAQHVEIRLTPEHLGNVAVEVTRTGDGMLQVVLHAETDQARSLLSEHTKSLGLMLQGSNQGEVRVEVARTQQGEQPWQQPDQNGGHRQDGQGQEGRGNQNGRQQQQSTEDFLHQLRIGLFQAQQV